MTRGDGERTRDRRVERGLSDASPERRGSVADRRAEANSRFVACRVAEWNLGVPVERVQEVLTERPLTLVPLAPIELAGLLNLRGHIVTVIDLRSRLGLAPRALDAKSMGVVIREGGDLFSIQVDTVGDVIDVAASAIKEPPTNLDPTWRHCCTGVVRLESGDLLAVLEVSRVITIPE